MASAVRAVLENARYTGSSDKGLYWAFRHPNPNLPPDTYHLTRRSGNGWTLLLSASRETRAVLAFFVQTPQDEQAVTEAMAWLSIPAVIARDEEAAFLRLPDGSIIRSRPYGGEKAKKK